MKILLLGAGNMGGAWLRQLAYAKLYNAIDDLRVIQPSMKKKLLYKDHKKITFHSGKDNIDENFIPDVSILAIKPQMFETVLPIYQNLLSESLVISIAAGKSLDETAKYTLGNNRIVRVMPNIGMNVGQSVNLIYATDEVDNKDREITQILLEPTGNQYWLDKEQDIDYLTPITGCGPAFYYQLCNELTEIMIHQGFDKELAKSLVRETFQASAIYSIEERSFSMLTKEVTSKGGVTEAALEVIKPRLHDTLADAYDVALQRIGELNDTSNE